MFAIVFKYPYSLWPRENKRDYSRKDGSETPTFKADTSVLYKSGKVVSVIHYSAVGPSSVAIQTLIDDCKLPQMVHGATGYRFLSDVPDPRGDDKHLLKSIRKSISSLEKLCGLLQSETKTIPVDSQQSLTRVHETIKIGHGVFISNPELEDKKKDSDMTEIYIKIGVQFNNSLTSIQYFNSHCSTIKLASVREASSIQLRRIDINTGMCLFSKSVLSVSPGNDQTINDNENLPIPPLPCSNKPTAYELEIITRLSSAIGDVVGLIGKPHKSRNIPISINIDIPDFQYYWTACKLFEQNLVTVNYVQSWIAAIDKRRKQLKNIMISAIRAMLLDRQLSGVDISVISGAEPVVEVIKERIAVGTVPALKELVGALRSQEENGVQWRDFLDNLDLQHQPSTVEDLGRLMYVFKTVRPALEHQQLSAAKGNSERLSGRRLIIQVDDVNEWKILDQSKAFLKKYSRRISELEDKTILVGLFPIQRIFSAGKGRTDLYLSDPGHRLCLDAEKTMIGLLDVISATYGMNVAKRLQFFCEREGFDILL